MIKELKDIASLEVAMHVKTVAALDSERVFLNYSKNKTFKVWEKPFEDLSIGCFGRSGLH